MIFTTINGVEYQLATTLRVAYAVQGCNNHKPYSKVFAEIGEMAIEDQIAILFCAFQVANPNNIITKKVFLDYYLDNMNLKEIMEQLKAVIEAITGFEAPAEGSEPKTEEDQGN